MTTTIEEPRLYSTQTAAKLLSLSQEHLRRLLREGQVVGVRLGTSPRWYVPRSEVAALLTR